MRLSELLTPERIRIPLAAASKGEAIRELVSLLGKDSDASNAILEAVLERERRMCTGLGRGIAIPHAKSALANGLEAAFGLASPPLDYGSLDREPVRAFFLLVSSPDRADAHLSALARISRMLASDAVQEELFAASDAHELRAILEREEADEGGDVR